jgi:hypothetical protein
MKSGADPNARALSSLPRTLACRSHPGRLRRPDANGQALAYLYSRDNPTEALQAKMLTKDEARRIAVNIARLSELLGSRQGDE